MAEDRWRRTGGGGPVALVSELEQAELDSRADGVGTVRRSELFVDRREVVLHRVRADVQRGADLLVR